MTKEVFLATISNNWQQFRMIKNTTKHNNKMDVLNPALAGWR
jgi:hypothetical protein